MSKKFCPKCGRETDKFYDNLCKNCFLEKISISKKLPDKIVARICKSCNKIHIESYSDYEIENAFEKFLAKTLKKENVKIIKYDIIGNKAIVNLESEIKGLKKSEEKQISLILKKFLCKFCNLKGGKYFRAILQIRADKEKVEKTLTEIENLIKKINREDNFAFISALDRREEGIDIYLGSKSAADRMARYLKDKYNVKVKISRTLFAVKTGKKVYRDTLLVSFR